MPIIEHRVNINRSVTDIFRFMSDFGNNPRWQPSGIKLERVGKVRMGDMIVGHQRMLGRMQVVNADVVDYLPNQRLAYTGVMGGYNFRTTYDFNLAQGGTACHYPHGHPHPLVPLHVPPLRAGRPARPDLGLAGAPENGDGRPP